MGHCERWRCESSSPSVAITIGTLTNLMGNNNTRCTFPKLLLGQIHLQCVFLFSLQPLFQARLQCFFAFLRCIWRILHRRSRRRATKSHRPYSTMRWKLERIDRKGIQWSAAYLRACAECDSLPPHRGLEWLDVGRSRILVSVPAQNRHVWMRASRFKRVDGLHAIHLSPLFPCFSSSTHASDHSCNCEKLGLSNLDLKEACSRRSLSCLRACRLWSLILSSG